MDIYLFFKLFKLLEIITDLSKPCFTTSAFKAIKSPLAVKLDGLTYIAFFNSSFVFTSLI